MRCYFTRGGHFVWVEDVQATTDADAIQLAIKVFYDRQAAESHAPYDGFELWDGNRTVHCHQARQMA